MLLIKCRLKRLITPDSNEYTVLFTDQIFINSLKRNTRSSACFKTHGQAFQTLGQAFQTLDRASEALRENKKLSRYFEKLGRVFEKLGQVLRKLGCVFVLQQSPCCPIQPR